MGTESISNGLQPSIHLASRALLETLIAHAEALQLYISQHETGAHVVDAGIEARGCAEAGRLITEICMGGLGQVSLMQSTTFKNWPATIQVSSEKPVLACLASQYAGWSLQHGKFFSLASGPARALAQREELFKELNYHDNADATVLVLETDKTPPAEVIEKVARDTKLAPENLTFILTPTNSVAGVTQIVGRVLEVALHKAHTLHFPLQNIVSGLGQAPLPPVASDFLTGMGRTNDAILFGGYVELMVSCTDDEAHQLATQLPSSASKDYGKTFAEVFKAYNMDFYAIDPLLFSPAKLKIINVNTGNKFEAGELNEALINQSFNN